MKLIPKSEPANSCTVAVISSCARPAARMWVQVGIRDPSRSICPVVQATNFVGGEDVYRRAIEISADD